MIPSLNHSERLSMALRGLYQTYGYRQYKVSQFEEYDLYAQNRSFLIGEHILSFSDINGQLLALKPDVTLSIIQNTRDDRRTRKLWYTENVYRVPRNAYGFQEILQTGLECLGEIDLYTMAEVLMLAAQSLETIRPEYVLDLSHIGILTGVFSHFEVPSSLSGEILDAIGEKNLHYLRELCAKGGLSEEASSLLTSLCRLGGSADDAIPALLALPLPEESRAAAQELQAVCSLLSVFGAYRVNLDLSVTNDTDYYNGLIFRGFVDGVASPVLSGGRYDHLLHRMGKTGGAIGFAVYLSELERLLAESREYDVDTLLIYDADSDPLQVAETAKALTDAGQTVRVQPRGEAAIRFRRIIEPDGKEAD